MPISDIIVLCTDEQILLFAAGLLSCIQYSNWHSTATMTTCKMLIIKLSKRQINSIDMRDIDITLQTKVGLPFIYIMQKINN